MKLEIPKMWDNKNHYINSETYKQQLSDRATNQHKNGCLNSINTYSRCKRGYWFNGVRKYFMRSLWERNYAWYLEFLLEKKEIKEWEYEPITFSFDKIKRGTRSYTPDFKVIYPDNTIKYHEVKGWMDKKSKTKLNRMKKYYPNINMEIIDEPRYKAIKKWSCIIKGWEI